MRIYKYLAAAVVIAVWALPVAVKAQENSLGTYSPYTMYGLGNLSHNTGSAFVGMGGASIGFRNGGKFDLQGDLRMNLANPASLSGLPVRSFIFDMGITGTNVYLGQNAPAGTVGTGGKGNRLRSSFNTFNFSNITLAFPVAPRLGLALNVSPFSEVGYRIHTDDVSYLADLGVVRYFYDGQGEISEAKAALGWEPFKNFSIGVEANYLWGNIDRTYQALILDYTGSGSYGEISSREGSGASTNEKVGRVFGALGMQYTVVDRERTRVTMGATYRMGGRLNSTVTDFIPSNNVFGDTIRFVQQHSATRMPHRVGVGVSVHKPRWVAAADYVFEGWGVNPYDAVNDVRYVNTHTLKLGTQFTPQRYDMRGNVASFFNRITYKAGVRLGSNYMQFGGMKMPERAVTAGFDMPFGAGTVSMLSVGVEYGTRGTFRQNMVKERYFKINLGVLLFGRDHDYWFEKYKYN